ncbi:predicted protein [Histoplasma capsulatum H143]|uniref:Uncharacterized protein n=1 Tax=Ajellomyces capsulatus (strain H143) TaxID=544712 RepID=C6HNB9_AJECH|nr:predicted protein [Histoplasma capsulatum H143]
MGWWRYTGGGVVVFPSCVALIGPSCWIPDLIISSFLVRISGVSPPTPIQPRNISSFNLPWSVQLLSQPVDVAASVWCIYKSIRDLSWRETSQQPNSKLQLHPLMVNRRSFSSAPE